MLNISDISSGFSRTSINAAFQSIEDELNKNTLRRNGLAEGEDNSMQVDLDMNSNYILNMGYNALENSPVPKKYLYTRSEIDALLGVIDPQLGEGAFQYSNSFTGDGTTTAFETGVPLNTVSSQVFIDGLLQYPSAYSIAGTTLTFNEAPPFNSDIRLITYTFTSIIDENLASSVSYSGATSGLSAANVQAAIDELDAQVDVNTANIATNTGDIATNTGDISAHDGRISTLEGRINPNNIRHSLLSSPLVNLFKPNKLVDTLSGKLSASRDSVASYVDRYGVVRYKGGNQATNLLVRSQEFDNASWTKSGGTVTANSAVAPDGTQTADTFNDGTATSTHSLTQPFTFANDYYTVSCFVKLATPAIAQGVELQINDGTVAKLLRVDLNNGEVFLSSSEMQYRVNDVGDGWYRLELTTITSAGAGSVGLFTINNKTSANYTGTNRDSFHVWGAQLERSRAMNGYLPTTSAAITSPTTSNLYVETPREESEGWLIEGASTNLVTYSEQFDNAAWVKADMSVSANDVIAPDGALTGDTLTVSIDGGFSQQITFGNPSGTYSFSIWLKTTTPHESVIFINEAAVASTTQVVSLTTEWQRFTVTRVCNTGGEIRAGIGGFGTTLASEVFICWGAQLEFLPFASSYIPTAGATATRAADDISASGDNNVNLLSSVNSVSWTANTLGTSSASQFHFSAIADDRFNFSAAFRFSNPTATTYYASGAGATYNLPASKQNTELAQYTYVYDSNTIEPYADGVDLGSFSVPYTDSVEKASILYFGRTNLASERLYGHIRDFRIYDFALNAEEAQFLAGVK